MGRRARRRHGTAYINPADVGVEGWDFPTRPDATGPRVILGAPVANRAWILPRWWECLERQTLQPDGFCFVWSPTEPDDGTFQLLSWPDMAPSRVLKSRLPYYTRDERNADRKDPWRAKHFAALRNELRGMFLRTSGDIFISLDTDVLLEDPRTLERLVDTIHEGWDVAAPLTYLHPLGRESFCYNAGFLGVGDRGTSSQTWVRADQNHVLPSHSIVKVDVPMAAYAIRRHAMGMCRYRVHDLGEDIGFAQSLQEHGFRVAWRVDLEARHVWSPQIFERAEALEA